MWGFRRRREAPGHAAVLGNTAIHFAHTVPTAKPIALGKAAKALLDSELALSASWPTDDSPRLPPSMAKVEKNLSRIRAMQAWTESLTDWRSLIRQSAAHPVIAFHVLRSVRKRGAGRDADSDDTPIDSLLEEAEKTLVEIQAMSVVERHIDEELFWSETEDENAYVRFHLHATTHTVRVADKTLSIALQPRVLLHRDGAVQLTVRVVLPSGCTPEQVIDASFLDEPLFTHSRIPEAYASKDTPWAGGEWEANSDGGMKMRVFDDETDPATITHWLQVVMGRVLRIIDARQGGPMYTYPMILTQAGDCCANWAERHSSAVVQLAVRSVPRSGDALTLQAGPDLSIHTTVRVHATAGSMLRLASGPWQSDLRDLHHTLLFERVGLSYVRLRSLERRLDAFQTRGRELMRSYRAVLAIEREVRGAHHRAGTARDIAAHVFEDLRVSATLTAVRQATGMLGERASTRASIRAARASNRIAIAGVVLAAIAAIPSLPAILALIEQQRAADPTGGVWAVVQTLATSPLLLSALVLGAVSLYGLFFLVKVTVLVVRHLWRLRKRGYSSQLSGYEITLDDPS